jgi:predicted dehydrogenase
VSYKYRSWDDWKRIDNQSNVHEAFRRQIDHFVGAIQTKCPAVVTNEDGEKSQIVIEAAYASADQRKEISL